MQSEKIIELKRQIEELQKELKAVREEELRNRPVKHCTKCKYCITDAWHGELICLKPKHNRKYCTAYIDMGVKVLTEDAKKKADYCDLYEEDGRENRSLADISEDIQLFWKDLFINWLTKHGWENQFEEEWKRWFINENETMKACGKDVKNERN